MIWAFLLFFSSLATAEGPEEKAKDQRSCAYWLEFLGDLSYLEARLRVANLKHEYNEVDYYSWMIVREMERVRREGGPSAEGTEKSL
jgi:hypothetical protein